MNNGERDITMTDATTEPTPLSFDRTALDYTPWAFWDTADAEAQRRQLDVQARLTREHGYLFADRVFVSELASITNDTLELGDRTYVAAGAYLSGSLQTGRDCTVNPYAVVRGEVVLGDAVRIGAHTSVLGFNHTMDDPDVEVFRQPVVSRGITIGDDVWIGSHVVVLDGVHVGDRSVLAAGAIVTKDVPAGAVVGGNPARVLRWRGGSGTTSSLADAVARFADEARDQAATVLDRCWDAERTLFSDKPGSPATVRAQCDAIEIADLLLGAAPPHLPRDEQVARLRSWQDPATGMVGELRPDGRVAPVRHERFDDSASYHVLCVGYALDLLGARFDHPVQVVAEATAADLVTELDALPWRDQAWAAGHWVDVLGTAQLWNLRRKVVSAGAVDSVLGWLLLHADPQTGMWGCPTTTEGLLQMVNGYYRATRGTFAQLGVPVPHPEAVIDTVLTHLRDVRFFRPERQTACNVLDVAHPLWLTRGSGHRTEEVVRRAEQLLRDALCCWTTDAGFGFQAQHPTTVGAGATTPGLQGTEMWLAIIWLLADIVGVSDHLGYRPRGVHRPEPAVLTSTPTRSRSSRAPRW